MSAENEPNKPDDFNANEVDVPRLVRLGDYVHAAKYSDYDPADPWKIGFVVRIIETWKPHPTLKTKIRRTYVIGEEDGTWSDFREYEHAKRITAEEGREFIEANTKKDTKMQNLTHPTKFAAKVAAGMTLAQIADFYQSSIYDGETLGRACEELANSLPCEPKNYTKHDRLMAVVAELL